MSVRCAAASCVMWAGRRCALNACPRACLRLRGHRAHPRRAAVAAAARLAAPACRAARSLPSPRWSCGRCSRGGLVSCSRCSQKLQTKASAVPLCFWHIWNAPVSNLIWLNAGLGGCLDEQGRRAWQCTPKRDRGAERFRRDAKKDSWGCHSELLVAKIGQNAGSCCTTLLRRPERESDALPSGPTPHRSTVPTHPSITHCSTHPLQPAEGLLLPSGTAHAPGS